MKKNLFFLILKKGMTFKIRLEPFHAVKKKKKPAGNDMFKVNN